MLSTQWRTLASIELADAYTDFVPGRQAIQCIKAALEFHRHTAEKFLRDSAHIDPGFDLFRPSTSGVRLGFPIIFVGFHVQ